jgi:hypothetical protein
MKRNFLFLLFSVLTFGALAQSGDVKGTIREVKPHFANTYSLLVDTTELILTTDEKDPGGKSFSINKAYKDLLVQKDGHYILNPKYSGKTFNVHYTVNGKGWKCIHSVKAARR